MRANIRRNELTRVVIVGGGIGGLKLAMALRNTNYQVVLVDKNNYNQFPPLIYQVASAGLEPSNIAFPFRRMFQGRKNFFFRMANVTRIDEEEQAIETSVGLIHYNYLVLAQGATTNFFGNKDVEANAMPMKTVENAMMLRNKILMELERAETEENPEARKQFLNFVIVGGGPSGVEIAGALADMKHNVLPRDYPDLMDRMHIYLIDSGQRLLKAMDEKSGQRAYEDLRRMNVHVRFGWRVIDYKDNVVTARNSETNEIKTLPSRCVIWVSGIRANTIGGVPQEAVGHAGRLLCDRFNRVRGMRGNVFCIGDQSLVEGDPEYKLGHPQLAQVALQQAVNVVKNIRKMDAADSPLPDEALTPFVYKNLGTMATIGRKCAVAEIGKVKFGGFFAWLLWLVVHLRSILGVKNKFIVLLNWMWSYFNYKQSLRLILRKNVEC